MKNDPVDLDLSTVPAELREEGWAPMYDKERRLIPHLFQKDGRVVHKPPGEIQAPTDWSIL